MKNFHMYKNLAILSQVGLTMIIPIFAGVYIGNWVDNKLGTRVFLFVFIIIGVMTSFLNLYKLATRSAKDHKRK
ncbi:MAG: AtpZ/AtpI family protein [Firmicutes bacterium]|jgi:F0F1-type ATP synthase assembly protein I|nr:AtpZ/AtpI family protein [Bacillota bacterium]